LRASDRSQLTQRPMDGGTEKGEGGGGERPSMGCLSATQPAAAGTRDSALGSIVPTDSGSIFRASATSRRRTRGFGGSRSAVYRLLFSGRSPVSATSPNSASSLTVPSPGFRFLRASRRTNPFGCRPPPQPHRSNTRTRREEMQQRPLRNPLLPPPPPPSTCKDVSLLDATKENDEWI
jgi:hypothetical protein